MIPDSQRNGRRGTPAPVGYLLTSALLLGLAYPPFSTGQLAFVALVPVLFILEDDLTYGKAFRGAYLWLLVMHCITVYWTGGFTHGRDGYLMLAGVALLLFHPLFYLPLVAAVVCIRNELGWRRLLVVLPALIVGWEYLLSKGELSFPWLSLGNTQTYDLEAVQFADITGVFGISLWVAVINVLIYLFLREIFTSPGRMVRSKVILLAGTVIILLIIPRAYGHVRLSSLRADGQQQSRNVRIALVQPDIDPFEKWSTHATAQLEVLRTMTNEAAVGQPDLIVWPETAIPFYILTPQNSGLFTMLRRQFDSLGVTLLSGVPNIMYYTDTTNVPPGSKRSPGGLRYDTFNSAMMLNPGNPLVQVYHKAILVPFAERVPYSDELTVLNVLRWNLGLGGWAIGRDSTVFRFATRGGDSTSVACFICYESIYSEYVSDFVRRGAQFLAVITNDSWWGNTSGAYQHKQFAVLRAIENRRWLVRCANGGISGVIDPTGSIRQESPLYTKAIIQCTVEPARELTFYTQHGDWIAHISLILSFGTLVAVMGSKFYRLVRRQQHEGSTSERGENETD